MADESRFHAGRNSPRVIFYSDMIENSDYAKLGAGNDYEKKGLFRGLALIAAREMK